MKLSVLFNNLAMFYQKAGIGYVIENLYLQLKKNKEIDTYFSQKYFSTITDTYVALEKMSSPVKKALGKCYSKALAELYGAFFISLSMWRARCKLEKLFRSIKIDIYHEPSHCILKEAIPYLDGVKLISDVHDLSPINNPEWHVKEHVKEIMEVSLPHILRSDFIITKSEFIRREFINQFKFDEDKIAAVPNAAAANYYCLSNEKKLEAKKGLSDVVGNDPFILYTGTVEPRKNLKRLFDALKIIKEDCSINLVIAGGFGWHYHDIVSYPKEIGIDGRVKFLGYVTEEQMLYLYNLCELFVYPSLYEGFGMPPLEAMSCGAVPVVSNVSSIPEVVGDAGVLFNPHSSEEMARKILLVLRDKDLRDDLRQKGFARSKEYSWEKSVEKIIDIYKKVMG